MKNQKQTKKHGFTLIELLVVVSIIALLVSILLPALAKAREAAKRAVCQSKEKAVGMACHMYAASNNGNLPEAYYVANGRHVLAFHRLINGGYVAPESDIWVCPGDAKPNIVDENSPDYPNWSMPKGKYSLTYNVFLGYRSETDYAQWVQFTGPGCYNIDKHRTPALVAVVRDKTGYEDTHHMQARGAWCAYMSPNHRNAGYDLLLADGHVTWVTLSTAYDYVWQQGPEQMAVSWSWSWK